MKLPVDFRQSLYAMTAELAAIEPLLLEEDRPEVRSILTETECHARTGGRGVSWTTRKAGREWIVILVNEDGNPHFGVELSGLNATLFTLDPSRRRMPLADARGSVVL